MIDLSQELFDNQLQNLDIYSIKANFDLILNLNRRTSENIGGKSFNTFARSSSLMTDNPNAYENSYRQKSNFDSNNNINDQSQGTSNEQLNTSGSNRRRKLPTIPQNKPASPLLTQQARVPHQAPTQSRVTPSPPSNASDVTSDKHQNRLEARSNRQLEFNSKSDSESVYDARNGGSQAVSNLHMTNSHEKRPSFKLKKQPVSLRRKRK